MPNNVLLETMFMSLSPLNEVAYKIDADTTVFRDKLYPLVEKQLDRPNGKQKYKQLVSNFIQKRSDDLYDTLPCARIVFGEDDANALFQALDIDKSFVTECIQKTYYGNEPHFSPLAAKDEFTVTMMCVIRYFYLKKMQKEAELACIHLAFSGKFYPSIHYNQWKVVLPARHIMEYTVNNSLNTKFDIVSEGSVIGAVRKISNVWYTTYSKNLKSFTDEDVVYIMINQLQSRLRSFLRNIANEYYKNWEKRDQLYMNYNSDSVEEDSYRLADSDSLRIQKMTEKAVNYMLSSGVDYAICRACSDSNITTKEMKSIMESLFGDPRSTIKIRELVMLMITAYCNYSDSKDKDVRNPKFITYTISPKPNAKQPELKKTQELIESLLSENSPAYIRRRSRLATKNSFERAIKMYFALSIHNANR